MNRLPFVLVCVLFSGCAQHRPAESPPSQGAVPTEVQGWLTRARNVTIIRDDWGIPHVKGRTDADAVFGLMYAQAEDDFNRIETNFLLSQGRLAEAQGEAEIWRDLRMKLFIDPRDMRAKYESSPDWLKQLMMAWADGLNFYLHTHPRVKPRVITRFEPWMALTFSEGSIGGDIERISLKELESFYDGKPIASTAAVTGLLELEPSGSNGFAISPSRSKSNRALLWINPHTSFFFRAEAQATSDEGLNVYGALTWGQFFVYQGFNESAGWMHTSSGVDNVDEFLETVVQRDGRYFYRYGDEERPLDVSTIVVPYRTANGTRERKFTVFRTHRGPIVRAAGGKWVSVRLMEEPVKALTQSYQRTKAKNLDEFMQVMRLHANSSNNTVFADSQGNIAYLHANFIPRRNPEFDWTQPVDGSDPATEWQGVHTVEEAPNVINPPNGWLYNTNNPPWTAADAHSPRQQDYPAYVDVSPQNPRGVHALRVLKVQDRFDPKSLTAAAFDSQLPAFEPLLPMLLDAYVSLPKTDARKQKLAQPIETLRGWDHRWSAESVATSLAVLWGEELWTRSIEDAARAKVPMYEYIEKRVSAAQRLDALNAVIDKLSTDFGRWNVPWGEVNRFQRLTGDIEQPFSDDGPSIPVPFTSARWGSLATFGARSYKESKKIYGTTGNSFLAVVEFGDKVSARAITAGGQSGDPSSPHFNDQALRYSLGDLREVYFYPEQLARHTERTYRPGELRVSPGTD
ncbi:acyl-homoserine-lactone acylase [Povalibacter uvarum]|uniref:Acyl-homoserine-lactone acylase n=1 Tax=Povalibacter uvarum TaxID=732238 RepID=A0A841HN06_9GAMM|nr:acylase [Povalibacter uvarum]MBB6094661.1 acyl-homoserine-lactone acylase [Povalibacter uvarum]